MSWRNENDLPTKYWLIHFDSDAPITLTTNLIEPSCSKCGCTQNALCLLITVPTTVTSSSKVQRTRSVRLKHGPDILKTVPPNM